MGANEPKDVFGGGARFKESGIAKSEDACKILFKRFIIKACNKNKGKKDSSCMSVSGFHRRRKKAINKCIRGN
jgi:hypothetical protein